MEALDRIQRGIAGPRQLRRIKSQAGEEPEEPDGWELTPYTWCVGLRWEGEPTDPNRRVVCKWARHREVRPDVGPFIVSHDDEFLLLPFPGLDAVIESRFLPGVQEGDNVPTSKALLTHIAWYVTAVTGPDSFTKRHETYVRPAVC